MENKRVLAYARRNIALAGELLLNLFTPALWLGIHLLTLSLMQESQTLWQERQLLPDRSQECLLLFIGIVLTLWTLWMHYWRSHASKMRLFAGFLLPLVTLITGLFWCRAAWVAIAVYERRFYIILSVFYCLESILCTFLVVLRQMDLIRFYLSAQGR